jgi:RNA polymerase sigma-70 factor (ECF subfamily)
VSDPSDVAEAAARADAEARLRALIEALTPAQRDVLLLRIFGGLTVEEVARAVRRRPGAVKALQRRGLETLRRMAETQAYLSELGER